MPQENAHERRKKNRYTLILVPDAESKRTRSLSVHRWGLGLGLLTAVFVIVSTVVAAILYTPLGTRLPISNAELERRYGKQIIGIQEQLNTIVREMAIVQGYNLRLRKALGEKISSYDSTLIASTGGDSSAGFHPQVDQGSESDTRSAPDANFRSVALVPVRGQGRPDALAQFPFILPADGYVSRGFDEKQFHYGVDFAGKPGSVILAAAEGTVVFSGWTYDDGFTMIITHGQGYLTVYKHNQSLLKITGTSVRRGDVIAFLGNTGKSSSGPHLHFEVWKDGIPQDPNNYLLSIQ